MKGKGGGGGVGPDSSPSCNCNLSQGYEIVVYSQKKNEGMALEMTC